MRKRGLDLFAQAEHIISKIRYKPDLNIYTQRCIDENAIEIRMIRTVQDVTDLKRVMPIYSYHKLHMDSLVDVDHVEDNIIQFIHYALKDFEMHECNEWFTYEGKRIFDPHKMLTATVQLKI